MGRSLAISLCHFNTLSTNGLTRASPIWPSPANIKSVFMPILLNFFCDGFPLLRSPAENKLDERQKEMTFYFVHEEKLMSPLGKGHLMKFPFEILQSEMTGVE